MKKFIVVTGGCGFVGYNLIKYFVSHVFQCLSIQEAKHNSEIFELLEEKIFYNLLHIEIELYKIKLAIVKEIKKSELSNESIKRLSENPLRILDSKNASDIEIFFIRNDKIQIALSRQIMRPRSFLMVFLRDNNLNSIFIDINDTLATDRIWSLANQFPKK